MFFRRFRYDITRRCYIKEILFIETFVQVVEGYFYSNIIGGLHDLNLMTSRRYFDWVITICNVVFNVTIFQI